VLLSSVFGPYAQDDEFGSRSINPMELYHNQVTRAQGAFSLRMFHRSWGIMMIQANIPAPTTVLDFPTREVFERELRDREYDIVGITSIIVNVGKVREMCRMVREISPRSTPMMPFDFWIRLIISLDRFSPASQIPRTALWEDSEGPVQSANYCKWAPLYRAGTGKTLRRHVRPVDNRYPV
jgi:hypothetical protein